MNPLISVIVPVYNTKEYLERCVNSLLAQTYSPLEIWLIDDGSNDTTELLCDQLAGKDSRIQVVHKPNGGTSTARNVGLSKVRGEYIGFVDSDDYVEPDMYEKLMAALLQNPAAGIAQIGRDEIDEAGNQMPNLCNPPKEETFVSSKDFLRELLLHKGDCSFCTKLISKALFQNRFFPEGKLNEDFRLLIQMLLETEGVLSLPGYGYHVFYRLGSNSRKKTKGEFSRVFPDSVENAHFAAETVPKKYTELADTAFRFQVFQCIEYLLHIPISLMNRERQDYVDIVAFLRKNWGKGMRNPILTKKNKIYLTLFCISPKGLRVLHAKLRGITPT